MEKGSKRGIALLQEIFDNGSVTTEMLEKKGYRDAASAARDVRDAGIPLITTMVESTTGGRAAQYTLGNSAEIREGRFHGRIAIPKKIRDAVFAHYGFVDWLTRAPMPSTALQVDHRIPFRVAGDLEAPSWNVEDFMPLDRSSQRSKSWACESCRNFALLDTSICRKCYWAYPEAYEHIAMKPIRRTEIAWIETDAKLHDRLKAEADAEGISLSDLLLRISRNHGS
ncbi:hypothetical protein J2S30_004273 [Herbaspirillum rubrisubalbicans]|uniref:hypothetical protein n=2 Tax=Herbaspirillum TaxID=963 RepID=UPI00209D7F7D|nr:hypothetical protein [Herbaspirillum rubrisubalbicans]MCP1575894.1 hypothetical protein [Herbaspirillum rubrisubalbicans]